MTSIPLQSRARQEAEQVGSLRRVRSLTVAALWKSLRAAQQELRPPDKTIFRQVPTVAALSREAHE